MPCADDKRFSNSFDVMLRGEEICSGAQRVHDADMLFDAIEAQTSVEGALKVQLIKQKSAKLSGGSGRSVRIIRPIQRFLPSGMRLENGLSTKTQVTTYFEEQSTHY